VCIKDCIEAILRVIDNDLTIGRAYNVSGKKSITISELFGLVAKHGNLKAPSIFLPPSVLYFPVGLLEGAWRLLQRPAEPLVTRIAIAIAGYDYEIVCDRAYRELDWVPEDDYASAVIAALTPP
jgi:nucleoside-diphosphate-sugar epimerase